jgi:23S rRNA (adenine2030-N6)-methyltransferase
LLYCLDALKRKSAAFFALDSHAGRGFYDLQSAEARQSGEAERGIQRLIEAAGGAAGRAAERGIQRLIEAAGGAAGQAAAGAGRAAGDAVLAGYLQAIRARHGKRLARYPGSPALIAASLRPQDRALFVELLPAEARAAGREIQSDGRVRTEIGDGYAALKAFLPPAERRGLVLIDPPYESLDELKILLQSFTAAYRRWPSGIYLMWYPIRSSTILPSMPTMPGWGWPAAAS